MLEGSDSFKALTASFPSEENGWTVDWNVVLASPVGEYAVRMSQTPQEPEYHAEGDVWTHTKLVCEALAEDHEFRAMTPRAREIVFLAALLHDIGKIWKTTSVDGKISSPGHCAAGATEARWLLWKEFDLAGAYEKRTFREAVCTLIRRHSVPVWLCYEARWKSHLALIASTGELTPDFTLRSLFALARADSRGRVSETQDDQLERIQLASILAEEAELLDGPLHFATPRTRFLWFSGRDCAHDIPAYNETWGEIAITCGFPGTGKDYWLRRNMPDARTISLDSIREELHAAHGEREHDVVELAFARAQDLLREKTTFVWNATNLKQRYRDRLTRLCHRFGASVRILWFETNWEENLRRNRSRAAAVPQHAVEEMLRKFEPPSFSEAENIDWIETVRE